MSVFVKFDPWGRMGNRMFQHALGSIISAHKRVPLYSPGLPNFSIPNTESPVVIPRDPIYTRNYGHNKIDYNELINTERDIIIDSFVQRAEYYKEHKEFLCNIFNIKKDITLNQGKLILHIRETDYVQLGIFHGYDYYRQLIYDTGFKDVTIVTDNSNCETVRKLIQDGCVLNTAGYVDKFEHTSDQRAMIDFNTLLYSENIAISQSTFSWWSCFLGEHKKIFFPLPSAKGMWRLEPDQDDIDLRLSWPNIITVC